MGETHMPRIDSMEPDTTKIQLSKSCPLEFFYAKSLFLQKQFRQCISTCREILEAEQDDQARHPLAQTFIRLYIALSHDDLARAMHDFSSTKLSAFDQAESLYHEAAASMPGVEALQHFMKKHDSVMQARRVASDASLPQSTSQSTLNSEVFRRPPSPSPFLSPPTRPLTSLPTITSPDSSDSESEDGFEEHDDFSQTASPQRMKRLPSTFSSMSLLEPQKQNHALLRPVNPGSVAKPYQPAHKTSPSPAQFRSRLPRLNTAGSLPSPQQTPPRQSSPVRKQLRSPDEEDWAVGESPPSPVSPLGSVFVPDDDEGTISPMSPSTPIDIHRDGFFPSAPTLTSSASGAAANSPLGDHLEGLEEQIFRHISLLHEARQRTLAAQAERTVKNSMRKVPASDANKFGGGMQQSRSFWLFTPQDVKAMDKQRRIEDGRKRLWSRPRFDPTRYRELADEALAEL